MSADLYFTYDEMLIGWDFSAQRRGCYLLAALYFPYAGIRESNTLNQALLTYDRLYLVYPAEQYERLGIATVDSPRGDYFREVYHGSEYLVRHGLIKMIPPSKLLEGNEVLFQDSYRADRRNAEMGRLARASGESDWLLFLEKVPESMFDLPEISRIVPKKYRHPHGPVRLPFLMGESIMTTHALIACAQVGLTPITDSRVHQQFLELRLKRGLRCLGKPSNRAESGFRLKSLGLQTRQNLVMKELLRFTLPNLGEVHPIQVIHFRQRYRAQLALLRASIAELVAELEVETDPRRFGEIAASTIESTIKPAYERLRHESEYSLTRFAHNVSWKKVKTVGPAALSGLGLTILSSLPPWVGLLTSSGLALGSAAVQETARVTGG